MFPMDSVLSAICEAAQEELKGKDKIDWTVNVELCFLYAQLGGHKAAGVNRYFAMVGIHNKFSSYTSREVHSKELWDHFDTMYDMAALNELECIPFPNHEQEFELPDDCEDILYSKFGVKLHSHTPEESGQLKNNANLKTTKKSKQVPPPSASSKSNAASPVVNKTVKVCLNKNEQKSMDVDNNPKVKTEIASSSKTKLKHSSSPFSVKNVKSEPSPVTKEEILDVPLFKKSKTERSSSPANVKKIKLDTTSSTSDSSKVALKQESKGSVVKQVKMEASENVAKTVKTEKDNSNKKGKVPASVESSSSKKSSKLDVSSATKKKNEAESTPKKVSEMAVKPEMKSPAKEFSLMKGSENDSSITHGSKKAVTTKKGESGESIKRQRKTKEEAPKKSSGSVRRRR